VPNTAASWLQGQGTPASSSHTHLSIYIL